MDAKKLGGKIITSLWTSWWRHQMETFSALLALCAGNSPVPGNSPHKGQWRGALMFFFYLRLNKRLSKQSIAWWFETLSRPLWRHCNVVSLLPRRLSTIRTIRHSWTLVFTRFGVKVVLTLREYMACIRLSTIENYLIRHEMMLSY